MQKVDALTMLQSAKSAHIQWRARAQVLVAGVPLEKEQVPVVYTDCKFGKWYYGAGQQLSALETYRAVEDLHQQLHMIYLQIFNRLFGDDDRSALKRIFGSKKKHVAENAAEAQRLLPQLIGVSETLLEAIGVVENQIRHMSEDEFNSLTGRDDSRRMEVELRAIN